MAPARAMAASATTGGAARDRARGGLRALADGGDRRHAGGADRRDDAGEQGDERCPTSSETTIVRVAKTVSPWGMSRPMRAEQGGQALGQAVARAPRPTSEATRPMMAASAMTERITWRRDAPRVRSVASSRERWATVIDRVLKMTKAPTKSAIAAEGQQEAADEGDRLARCPALSRRALLVAGRDAATSAGSSGAISRGQLGPRETPGRGGHLDRVEAGLAEHAAGGGDVEDGDGRAAQRVDVAEAREAGDA